jgi:diguanylate cyclase (GGDEF)-like protein
MMLDVDHFKKFNDFFGHAAGDECLRAVAQTIEKNIRVDFDLLARYGGEEFIAILPSADAEMAYEIGERVRIAIETMAFRDDWHLTVSIGVAVSNFGPALDTAEALVARADKALYDAKSEGRNKTVLYPDPSDCLANDVCALGFSKIANILPEQKSS